MPHSVIVIIMIIIPMHRIIATVKSIHLLEVAVIIITGIIRITLVLIIAHVQTAIIVFIAAIANITIVNKINSSVMILIQKVILTLIGLVLLLLRLNILSAI